MPTALLLLLALAATSDDQPGGDAPLLILPVDGPAESAKAMEAELAAALRRRIGVDAVVTHGEVDVALTAERTKDVLGCDSVGCLTDILGALGGRFALGVTLTPGTPLSNVTVILRDLEDATRSFRLERRAPSLNPARLRGLADDLARALTDAAGWQIAISDEGASSTQVATPGASGGTLRIASVPSGARVELNSRAIGDAPMVLSGLSAGDYRLKLRRKGYKDHKQLFALDSGADQQVNVQMRELRDWKFGLTVGFSPRNATLEVGGVSTAQSMVFLDAGATYAREIRGPFQLGALVGYGALLHSGTNATALNLGSADHHGFMAGVSASVGGCICMSALAGLGATMGNTAEERQAAQEWLDSDESSANWAIAHARLVGKLVARTPGILGAELGLELGMLGVMHFDVFWAPIIAGSRSREGDGFRLTGIDQSSFGVRIILGFSAFYRNPD